MTSHDTIVTTAVFTTHAPVQCQASTSDRLSTDATRQTQGPLVPDQSYQNYLTLGHQKVI